MQLQTKVAIEKPNFAIRHEDKLMSLGSCFAQNMADKLDLHKFNIISNPFGILYNPLSIAKSLEAILNEKTYTKEDLFHHNERWHSFDHHSDFSHSALEATLNTINSNIKNARQRLIEAQILIITLGTANVFFKKATNELVGNCHKIPNHQFEKRIIEVKEVVTALKKSFDAIRTQNPGIKIILTLSPIRHFKDGLIENQRSKATLLLAIHELVNHALVNKCKDLYYFPAYEITLDELRDYRFYKADMVHLSDVALDYIWEKFCETFFLDTTIAMNAKFSKLHQALRHRPFNPASGQHQAFLKKQSEQCKKFQKDFPFLDFSTELEYFTL
jgi:hypothetical protein